MITFRWCGGLINIAYECTGVRSVVALLAIATILALGQRRWLYRIGLFGFAVIYAGIGNALRIVSILAFCTISRDFALNEWHDISGYVFIVCETLLLAKTAEWLKERDDVYSSKREGDLI